MAYVDCFALAQYISEKSLDGALDTYVCAVMRLAQEKESFKAFTTELLHQARVRLIYFHIYQKGHVNPRLLKILLQESMALFPHNTIFLSLFVWNEARLPILDRIREPLSFMKADPESRYEQVLADHAQSPIIPQWPPVSVHLFSIHMGLCRPVVTGGTQKSVRDAFERAIAERSGDPRKSFGHDSACSNLTIWKLYILFELEHALDLQAAKAVFYRAINACPWSKELVLLAFERLRERLPGDREGLHFNDLRQLYNLLNEKQLRVHVNLTKGLEEMDARKARADAEAAAWLEILETELNGGKVAPF